MPFTRNRFFGRKGRQFDDNDTDAEHYRKIFVGGLTYETTKEDLEKHFSTFGEIVDSVVMIYPDSKRSRGFGFVTFDSMDAVDAVQEARPHLIDGREVETKRATPREQRDSRDAQLCVKKLFVGGIPEDSTEDDVRAGCESYGTITEIDILKHRDTGKPRGFCFVTFDDYDVVDKIAMKGYVEVLEKKCEVKKAIPKGEDKFSRFNDRFSDRGSGDRGGRDRSRSERGGARFSDSSRPGRFRSRSPVYNRYQGSSSSGFGGFGGGGGGGGGAAVSPVQYPQQSAGAGDSLSGLSQLAPALASLGTIVGLLSNQNQPVNTGTNALNQLVSALQSTVSSGGGGTGGMEQNQSRGGYSDRDSGYGASNSYSSGFSNSGYNSGYSTGYGNRMKDDYSR